MIRKVRPDDFDELLKIEAEAFPKSQYDLGQFWRLHQAYPSTFLVDVSHLQEVAREKATNQEDTTEDLAIVKHRLNYAEEHLQLLEQSLGIVS